MIRTIIRTIRMAMSMPNAQEGTYPVPRLIITTLRGSTITAITKIAINDLSALGGVRSMCMLWEQALDKVESRCIIWA